MREQMSPKDMTVSKKAAAKNGLVFVLFEQSTTVKYRGYLISNWGLLITTWGYFNQLGIFSVCSLLEYKLYH